MPEQRRGGSRTQTRERPQAVPTATASVADQLNAAPTKSTALARLETLPTTTLEHFSKAGYNEMRLAMIWQQCARDLNLGELIYFMERCVITGLDPLRKQIYAIKRKDRRSPSGFTVAHQVGIDGFRAIADKSGAYAGSDSPMFTEPTVAPGGKEAHEVCRVTVHKIVQGVRVPFVGECRLSEYWPAGEVNDAMWRQHPHNQLAKCTEAQALRKGFPVALGEFEVYGELGGNNDAEAAVIDQVADRATPKDANVRRLDEGDQAANAAEYDRTYGAAYADDPPLEQPSDTSSSAQASGQVDGSDSSTANAEPKQEPIEAEGRVVQHDNGETVNTVNTASGEILDPGEPMRVISETLAPEHRQSFLPKGVDKDDDTPPWEEPPARMPQSAAIPPKELPGADGGIIEKVAERAAQGLCTDPECVAANARNKAAADTNPPRCLNHVGD